MCAVEVNRNGLYQPEGHIINLRILERPGVVLPVHVGKHRHLFCFLAMSVHSCYQCVRQQLPSGSPVSARFATICAGAFEISALQEKLLSLPTAVRACARPSHQITTSHHGCVCDALGCEAGLSVEAALRAGAPADARPLQADAGAPGLPGAHTLEPLLHTQPALSLSRTSTVTWPQCCCMPNLLLASLHT